MREVGRIVGSVVDRDDVIAAADFPRGVEQQQVDGSPMRKVSAKPITLTSTPQSSPRPQWPSLRAFSFHGAFTIAALLSSGMGEDAGSGGLDTS